jgi:hypothetical protein
MAVTHAADPPPAMMKSKFSAKPVLRLNAPMRATLLSHLEQEYVGW